MTGNDQLVALVRTVVPAVVGLLLAAAAKGRIDKMPRDADGNVLLEVLPNPALNLRKAI
jgi:hypothetical protein